eukprot:TRINITY_DN2566_c0_g1_i3.p1 TRINITY_DN2566_c0_g1~~TRINITY_DN2566_c0_g1_i3.p1  ORF type:complete len:602 (+),score=160.48 TRINITY_DN2566_c0_g1_i3:56-1807(+)
MAKNTWVALLLLTVVGGGLLRVLSPKQLRGLPGAASLNRVEGMLRNMTTYRVGTQENPWANASHWETPFIAWKDTELYRDPVRKDRPAYLRLTTGMLRTVLHDRALFWARNPDGAMRVFLAQDDRQVDGAAGGARRRSWSDTWERVVSGLKHEVHLEWILEETLRLPAATDHTGVVAFTGLKPDTPYRYVMQLDINGTWFNHLSGSLRTFPAPGSIVTTPFVFGFGSCINPVDKRSNTGMSVKLLGDWGLRFFFFLGDFIYFWDELPHVVEEYNRYYYRKLMTREVAHAMRSTPWMFQFDDHEVHNDWASEGNPGAHPYYKPAFEAWGNMISSANPPTGSPVAIPAADAPFVKWYTVSYGNFHYFVLDTRSFKVNTADLTGPLLGNLQKSALAAWVKQKCLRKDLAWCFLVSPTIFTHGSYRKDLWFGNMKEQVEVKALLEGQPGVTSPVSILSGDSHIAAIWEVADHIHEFTCSPVDAFGLFYPWFRPPRFESPPKNPRLRRKWKRSRAEWPALGDLPPPKAFYEAIPRHLAPAGFNCLIQAETIVSEGTATVSVRFDIVNGHTEGGNLLYSHFQNYTHPMP